MKETGDKMVAVTRNGLRRLPLPPIKEHDDKEDRGRVLVIGGSRRIPGSILLSGTAALRAGAGKLQLATVVDASVALGIAMPEALSLGLPATRNGEIEGKSFPKILASLAKTADAVLMGPGIGEDSVSAVFIRSLIAHLRASTLLVLDGAALQPLYRSPGLLAPLAGRAILTPHRGEMATLLGMDVPKGKEREAARESSRRYGATVAFKGPTTWIVDPNGTTRYFSGGCVGLGTSGSGDTLAGIIAGLAARGASPTVAAAWGVWIHGKAGRRLSRRIGRIGFLARELLMEIPSLAEAS